MLFDIQKFNKEIRALRALSLSEDLDNLNSERIKANIILAIANEAPSNPQHSNFVGIRDNFMKYIVPALIGLGLMGGTALASEYSLPGSILYPVKIFKEKIEIGVALSGEAKARAESRHAEERLDELAKLHAGADSELKSNEIKTAVKAETALKAEQEANARVEFQVKKAIQVLSGVRVRLEAKGKTTAAVKIEQNIVKLRGQAESQGFEVKVENNNQGGVEVEVKRKGEVQGRVELSPEVNGQIKKAPVKGKEDSFGGD